ncbi:MAG TPA: asparagine synthase-related protein [Vicinamibacterales bacterium]|nr:asparagine synthase-related protein [Vicinamibacterales bacterium]
MILLAGLTHGGAPALDAWLSRVPAAGDAARHVAGDLALALGGAPGPAAVFCPFEGGCLAVAGSFQGPFPGSPPPEAPWQDTIGAWLVQRYERDGEAFLDGLVGQYVVALADRRRGHVLLGCDPYGARKLFVRDRAGGLAFASSLSVLAQSEPGGVPLDRSLEDTLLSFEFLPWERTPLNGVKYLKPGTLLRVTPEGTSRRTIEPAAFPDAAAAAGLTAEEELIEALDDLMRTSILDQAPPGERIGVLLGGVDSALIAAYLARAGRDVETFTFQFEDARYNQAHCEALARHLGIRHNWVPITPSVIRDGLSHYADVFNQVSAIPHYVIETAHVCRTIRSRGIRHGLTGDGCDEIFLGYPSVYRRARLFMRLPSVPSSLTRPIEGALALPFIEDRAGHLARFTRNYVHILGRRWPARGHISNRIFDRYSLDRLRRGASPPQDMDPEEVLERLAEGLDRLSPLRLAYHGKSSVGLNKIKLEGSAHSAGVSLVSPYQHPRMTAFGAKLPDALLRRADDAGTAVTGKYILFRMIERKGHLPREIIYQRKASPVNAPVDYWYLGELRPFVLETIDDLPFEYDRAYVERMLTLKRTEEWFRARISLARSIFHPVALLMTYANLNRTIRGAAAEQSRS